MNQNIAPKNLKIFEPFICVNMFLDYKDTILVYFVFIPRGQICITLHLWGSKSGHLLGRTAGGGDGREGGG